MLSNACTYLRHLEQDLPDAEVIQAALESSLSEEVLEVAVFTELGLNIEVVLRLPRVAEIEDVLVATKSLENMDFPHLVLTVLDTKIWLLRLFHSPNIADLACKPSSRAANNRLRNAVNLGKLSDTNCLNTLKARRQCGVDIVCKEARDRCSECTRSDTSTKVHARISRSSGSSGWETV